MKMRMQRVAATIAVFSLLGVVTAYNDPGSYGFDIDSLLECHVQNPFYGSPNQPPSKVEDIPVIPFQPAPSGQPYLPIESGFQRPSGRIDIRRLTNFVGNDLNIQLVAIRDTRPDSALVTPVIARTIIPINLNTASGGDGIGMRVPDNMDYRPMVNDTLNELVLNPMLTEVERNGILRVIRELTLRCELVANWTRLPDTYWPFWYSASFCTGSTCSLPSGLTCEPIISANSLLYIVVLRWDCCWSLRYSQWRWECGWRKVRIPIISRCHCGCGPLYVGDGFSYTARLGGPFTIAIDDFISNGKK